MLEKDLWLVWALGALFTQPRAPTYSFKGGTSLSKVYDAIHRFSEDVDITVDPDHPDLIEHLKPVEEGVSKTQLKKRGELARDKLPSYLKNVLVPHLESVTTRHPLHSRPRITYDELAPHQVRIYYPSVFEATPDPSYIAENVLLEFGARAGTVPSRERKVITYLSQIPGFRGNVSLPSAAVQALALERTFWEKVTLIHFENTRDDSATPKHRYARHWSDLYQISSNPDWLSSALAARDTLQKVMHIKHVHYSGKGVSYADCGTGHLRLVPDKRLHTLLAADFEEMQRAGMFVQEPPTFSRITAHLDALENQINEQFARNPIPH